MRSDGTRACAWRNEYLSGRMRLEADPLDWGLLELALRFNGPELRLTALQDDVKPR